MPSIESVEQKNSKSRKIMRYAVQLILMIAILAALLWYVEHYVGFIPLYNDLLNIKLEYLALSFLVYFTINILFTVRLRYILGRDGIKTTFGRTLLAQYAGMLSSDVTPGRSGYILTPIYLRDQNVPSSKSLNGILGIQTIEFLIKVIGSVSCVMYLISTVPAKNWTQFGTFAGVNIGLLIAALGIILMLVGVILMAAFTWSKRAISLFDRIANSRFLKPFAGGIMGKLDEYKESGKKTRHAIPVIILITATCWTLKGFEWFFLGQALGITQIPWIGFFLIQPLATALAFVPITPAGIGVQEFGIIGIFTLLLGVASAPATAFALLSRGLLIFEDLAGLPQIAKTSSSLLFLRSRKKSSANIPDANLPAKGS